MCVVSSFAPREIDLNRAGSRGVQLLKAFLEYAASGGSRLPEAEHAGEVSLNAFEADVRDALEAKGVITRSQFGSLVTALTWWRCILKIEVDQCSPSSATELHIILAPRLVTGIGYAKPI